MNTIRTIILLALMAGAAAAVFLTHADGIMGVSETSLLGRTAGQRTNAVQAAAAIDGAVLESGHTFSFNRTVGPWTSGRGYVRAPVSYEGEMVKDWGGGVCQTSSTVYNAALSAGLTVVERHRHTWAPLYVTPGRDAAVAQYDIDLRLRNPYPWPVRLQARVEGDRLIVEVIGRLPGPVANIACETKPSAQPGEVVRASSVLPVGRRRIINRGKPGARVSVYRTFVKGPRAGLRELVSRDSYPAMNRIVMIGETD